jgi:cyclopropane-fatty-acyl-phospholipid synthase
MSTKRVAIIGGGVSGLAAAWHLHATSNASSSQGGGGGGGGGCVVDVVLFESETRLGGHAHTLTLDTKRFTCREYANGTAAAAAAAAVVAGGAGDEEEEEEKKKDDDDKEDDEVDVDVGFMVYNSGNYPNMTRWFDSLGVGGEDTDMSLSVSLDSGSKEWSSRDLRGLFANPLSIFRYEFRSFLRDLSRFNVEAGDLLLLPDDDPRRGATIGEYLSREGYGPAFASYYLLPMMAALWSSSHEDVLAFPASSLVEFMCNHRMLQLFDRPVYKTPAGRSVSYTRKMAEILGDRARTGTPIIALRKYNDASSSSTGGGGCEYELFTTGYVSVGRFDHVVFACHPPQAVRILESANDDDDDGKKEMGMTTTIDAGLVDALKSVEYGDNVVYVHSDPALMPTRKVAWGSWNCMGKSTLLTTRLQQRRDGMAGEAMEGSASGFGNRLNDEGGGGGGIGIGIDDKSLEGEDGRMRAVYVTYYLNRLQNLKTKTDVFVSLNPHVPPKSELVYRRQVMAHPQFNARTHAGRSTIKDDYQGKDGLWFCGAYMCYGFHEDGCRSGFEVATSINGVALPWSGDGAAVGGDAPTTAMMVLPPPDLARSNAERNDGLYRRLRHMITYRIPVAVCKSLVTRFLRSAISSGRLVLKLNDGSLLSFGDGSACGDDVRPVTARVYDDWFFVKVATEYDLGLARSYMAGHFLVEGLEGEDDYPRALRCSPDGGGGGEGRCIIRTTGAETNGVIGDPVGLTRLFLLFVGNRDTGSIGLRSSRQHTYANALQNASGLAISKFGSFVNYLRFKIFMDNSERGGSLRNIHAHYDLSNDLFRTFLDKETLMYSSAIYDAVAAPPSIPGGPPSGLLFGGSLEEAQWRKLDTLCDRAQIRPGQTLLDIGFGWGGLSLHAAKKYGCRVTGITLSVEQKALAEERVAKEGLGHLINFEVVDYRTFARRGDNRGKFDRVVSCEMIEAVGHEHLGEFFWAVEQVLAYDGVLVMEAITTPEARYETYLRSTDFINTVIFPGGIAPSLHALVDASYKWSTLTLEHIDNIGLHYAETLAEWRRRFNANEAIVRKMGFDDVFLRVWNYYMTYCEAGFRSQTENCLILVFSRPGNQALVPLSESRSVTQMKTLTKEEVEKWLE